MIPLSQMHDLDGLAKRLPSPLAVPLAQLSLHIDGRDWFKAFLAGMDVFQVGLRWATFVGISDLMQKLEQNDRFVQRAQLERVYPAIHEVLLPRRSHGHWLACARTIIRTYESDPDAFLLPAFIRAQTESGDAVAPLEKNLEELIAIRNTYAHRDAALPSPAISRQRWETLDPVLGGMVSQLATFVDSELVRFDTPAEPDEGAPGWYHSDGHLTLRGFNMHELALRTRRPERFYTGAHPPQLGRLYLFNRDRTQGLTLHPFLLFDLSGDLLTEDRLRDGAATFLFNELQDRGVLYTTNTGTTSIEITAEDERTEHLAGPILRRFEQLKYVTAASDTERLHALPGFPRRSKVVDFSHLVAFHTDAFVGRTDDIERIEHAIAGPFRAVWVRGQPGFGKTALLARLAQMLPHATGYFISAEKGTANASTFLQHMSQAIIDRFRFPDVLPDDAGDVEALRATWNDLTARAAERLRRESKKLVFIIDGLDESLRYAATEDERVLQHLPTTRDEVPEGVFFVVASRPTEVDLSALVDFTIDLEPFSAEQVSTILALHGWSSEAAQLAFERSAGNPLYFRFLLDGIKTGRFTERAAVRLPEGIDGLYRSFWVEWTRDAKQRKDLTAAKLADASLHLLGFLSAAREPLSLPDLHELLLRIDLRITAEFLRTVLRKEHLGRFIIGTTRFTLFHDTLRAFVAGATRAPDASGPYGGAQLYHEILAEWCVTARESAYPADYQVHHLLHARRFEVVIERIAEKSGETQSRALGRDGRMRLRDIDAGVAAARELGDLPRVFRFSAQRLILQAEHLAIADPATAVVLAKAGGADALEELYGACEAAEARWQVASSAVAVAVMGAPLLDLHVWQSRLAQLAAKAHATGEWDISWLAKLLRDLHDVDAEKIAGVLGSLPEIEPDEAGKTLVEALLDRPLVAWALISTLPEPEYASSDYVDSLHRLAAVLLHREHEEAWDALALGQRTISFSFSLGDPVPSHFLRPFLAADAERTLATVSIPPESRDEIQSVAYSLSLGRLIIGALGGMPDSWCDDQPARVRAPLLALVAAESPSARAIERAGEALLGDLDEIPLPVALACLANLDRAAVALAGTGAGSSWRDQLFDVLHSAQGAAEAARLLWGHRRERQVELALSSRLLAAGQFINEFGHLFEDHLSAVLFALSATPSTVATLLHPDLHAWIEAYGGARDGCRGDALPAMHALRLRLADFVRKHNDADDVQSLVLPHLLVFAGDPRSGLQLDRIGPLQGLAAYAPELVGVLYPSMDVGDSVRALERLTNDAGRPIEPTSLVRSILVGRSYVDPRWALETWRELDASWQTDLGFSGGLARASYATGLHDEAYALAQSGFGFEGYWNLFGATDHGPFGAFLDDVEAGVLPEGAVASDADLVQLVEHALGSLPLQPRRERLNGWADAAAAGQPISNAQLLVLLRQLREIDASRLDGVTSAGQRLLTTGAAVASLIPWIAEVTTSHADRGIRLLRVLLESTAGGDSEGVSVLTAELDTAIADALTSVNDVGPYSEPFMRTVAGPWFPRTRRVIVARLIQTGYGSNVLDPFLEIDTLGDVRDLIAVMKPAAITSWLVERLRAAALAAAGDAENGEELLRIGAFLLASRVWDDVSARQLAGAVARRLLQLDTEGSLSDGFSLLADAILLREPNALVPESVPMIEGVIGDSVAEADPELAWELLEVCGETARAGQAARVFASAVKTNPAWAAAVVGSVLATDNAHALLESALDASRSDTWHLFRGLAARALQLVGPEELSAGAWRKLLARDIELAATAVTMSRTSPLAWLELGSASHVRDREGREVVAGIAEMLKQYPAVAAETLAEALRSGAANTYELTQSVVLLGALQDVGGTEAVNVLRDTLVAALHDPAVGLDEDDRGRVLQDLAVREPQLAARITLDLGYAGLYLRDILREIAAAGSAGPELFNAVRKRIFPKLDRFGRSRALPFMLAHLPASEAVALARRDVGSDTYLDVLEFCQEIVVVRSPSATDAAEMLSMLKTKAQVLKLHCAILGREDSTTREDYAALRQHVWETVLEGTVQVSSVFDDRFELRFGSGMDNDVDETDVWAVVFALHPVDMTRLLEEHATALRGAQRIGVAKWTNEVIEDAIPHLLRHDPDWLLPRIPTLLVRYPDLRADAIVAGIVDTYEATDALTALAVFRWSSIENAVARVLEAAPEGASTRRCLEILFDRHLRTAEDPAGVLRLCLRYAAKAGYDPLELSIAMAQQLSGVLERASVAPARDGITFAALLAIARGEASDAEEPTPDAAGDPLDGLDGATRRKVATLQRMIREYAAVGGDALLFEAELSRLLGGASDA